MKISGRYNTIKIYGNADFHTIAQAKYLCDIDSLKDETLILMPDSCPGILAPIGLCATYSDKILPALVSGDIGCGVDTYLFKNKQIEFSKLDKIIKEQVLAHKKVESILESYQTKVSLEDLNCKKKIDIQRVMNSCGTLGSGNHFIEIEKDENKNLYLTIHSGSRLLGTQVYEYYMDKGFEAIGDKTFNRVCTYLEGDLKDAYLHDIQIVQAYARANRECMAYIIGKFLKNRVELFASSVHNYVDVENNIIRKGAISARENETVVIPINSRDGVIIGHGLGNREWLSSAPHGAGRLYSRGESKNYFTKNETRKLTFSNVR